MKPRPTTLIGTGCFNGIKQHFPIEYVYLAVVALSIEIQANRACDKEEIASKSRPS